MTNSKHIPKRRFKEFASEDGWEKGKLLDNISQIVDFRGRTPKKLGMDWSKEGYLALSALNVKNGYIDRTVESHFGDEELYNKWMSGKDLHKNQVIFTTEAPMGNVAQIPDENKYILSQRTIAFKVADSKITDDFLAVLLKSKSTFDSLLSLTSGGTAKGVSQKSLEKLSVFIPKDLKEQSFIALYLKKIDSLINRHQHKLDKLKNLKKAYLAELFPAEGERVPKRRFPGFEGEWEYNKLMELAEFSKGKGYSKSDLQVEGQPIILYGRLYTKYETVISQVDTFTDIKENSVLSKGGEVLVPSSGESADDIARASVVEKAGIIIGGDLNIIKLYEKVEPVFLALAISNGKQKEEISKRAQGKSVVHVNNDDLKQVSILSPSLSEQKQIGNFFKKLNQSISLQQQKLDKLNDLKKAYLNELFV